MNMRKEERDYRSLERESMYSIFGPLDGQEPPERPRKRKRLLTLPFSLTSTTRPGPWS